MPVQIMLKLIRLIHTAVWVLLAGCVLALPVPARCRRFDWHRVSQRW